MHRYLRYLVLPILVSTSCTLFNKSSAPRTLEEYMQMRERPILTPDQACQIFPTTVTDINKQADFAIEAARAAFAVIKAEPAQERTFASTPGKLDTALGTFSQCMATLELLSMASIDKALREAAQQAYIKLKQASVDLAYDQQIYEAFCQYEQNGMQREQLNPEELYFFKNSMADFRRHGLALPAEELDAVKVLEKEIGKLRIDFETNIANDKSTVVVSKADLAGLQEDFIARLKRDGERYVLTCDGPTFMEVMQNCSVAATRRALSTAYNDRAYPANGVILKQLLDKQQQLAQLLGYEDFAAFDCEDTMARSPERIEQFLEGLMSRAQPKVKQEVENLISDLPAGVELDEQGRLQPWDYAYVHNYHKKKYHSINETAIAEYFPVDKALDGMLGIYQQLLGLTFSECTPTQVWDNDVRLIKIERTADKQLLGYVFLDLYPYDNTYSHACCAPIVPGTKVIDQATGKEIIKPAVAVVIANFPRATADKPALLKFDDVETFFHEFGHAMHSIVGATQLQSQSGSSVKVDFVEMPSQIFEEWMYDKEMLQRISSHYKTGAGLPDELIEKKIELKKFDSGYFVARQSMLSMFVFKLCQKGFDGDCDQLANKLAAEAVPLVARNKDAHFYASFGHFANPLYISKYYLYMWSKVYALDIFAVIKEAGLMNPVIGKRFVDSLIGRGGSRDPNELLVDFLGREPNQDAFFQDLGL